MLNMIKSELYKTARRPYVYLVVGITCLLILFIVLLFYFSNYSFSAGDRTYYEHIASMLLQVLSIGVYFVAPITDAVFSEEYKHQTMKNTLSFGMPRSSYYLGKLFTQLIVAIISMAVIFAITLGGAWVLLGVSDGAGAAQITQLVLGRMLLALPLWIGALCISNFLAFLIKSSTLYAILYVLLFALVAPLIQVLGMSLSPVFTQIHEWLIMPQFGMLTGAETLQNMDIIRCVVVGLGHGLVATLLGLMIFRKKEIK